MRLSSRLLGNAATNYLRLGISLMLGLFTTWYMIGALGVAGFGLIALASSSTGISHAIERSIRFGLVPELATAIASGDSGTLRTTVAAAFRLCARATLPLAALAALLAALAAVGFFNTPPNEPGLELALAVLILGEGLHAGVRLLTAPWFQSLFASQAIAVDNLLMVVARLTYTGSALLVFGWLLPDASLAVRVVGFAATRVSLQLVDVVLGIWLARRRLPALGIAGSGHDEAKYREVRSTVWHSSQVLLLQGLNPKILAVLINLFFGLAYNGLWQVVLQLSSFVKLFSEALLRGVESIVPHLQRDGRQRTVVDLLARSIRYQVALTLPLILTVGVWLVRLLELWIGDRVAADPNLTAAGISAGEALVTVARMTWIMLAWQAIRSSFYGIERILFGAGKVRSYAWFPKWGTLIVTLLGGLFLGGLHEPLGAPIALVVVQALYTVVTLRAARRETGLRIGPTLLRSLPRPLAVNALLLVALLASRPAVADAEPIALALAAVAGGLLYTLAALVVVPEPDERPRLAELLRLRRGRRATADGPTDTPSSQSLE